MLSLNYLSFAFFATIFTPLLRHNKYDLIFVYEPSPITVGIPALFIKKITRAPIIFWVQDLWPESLSATASVNNSFLLKAIGGLVNFIYKGSDVILVTSRAFVDSISSRVTNKNKIHYFPQYGEAVYQPMVLPDDSPERVLLPTGFIVMFAGNIGTAQDFQTIISAAEKLKYHKDIHFVIVGNGRMKSWVESEINSRKLTNSFHLIGHYPVESMPRFFSLADVMLVTLKKDPVFSLTIPAKIQSYLACGKPIVAALEGESANIIAEAKAGVAVGCESPDALATAILKLKSLSADELRQMGKNGLLYYRENFSRNMLLDRLENWMKQLVSEIR